MHTMKKLPIGIDDFEKLRTENFYYVDKTGLIRELLENWGEVNLFTRPRRFGKSLNISMLKYFFSYDTNPGLFEGLDIARDEPLCQQYMGKFPVISLTLKGVSSQTFEGARAMLRFMAGTAAMEFQFLSESDKLSSAEKDQYAQLIAIDPTGRQTFLMPDEALENSLYTLSKLLHKHFGQKVIILIDEYDVPLDKAQQAGYYDEMIVLIRNLFGQALKTNPHLFFAVLTGCLRIAKESIFTGINNFKVFSIVNVRFHEHFGFTDQEVRAMLEHYHLEDQYSLMREWYDGYQFGQMDIYCPWDVINYSDLLRSEPDTLPRAFWINTSGNDIIRRFLKTAKSTTRRELEQLVNGGTIDKKVIQELTYRELYKNIDYMWSVLFTTGYLTQRGKPDGDIFHLAIPNLEIKKIFVEQILEWFQEEAGRDTGALDAFCDAFAKGDAGEAERQFNAYLKKTISIRDTSVRKDKKENFYHGILLGLLSRREDWDISSNAESGDGFSDILVEIEDQNIGIVIEVKYPDSSNLEKGCLEALEQIEKKNYTARLAEDGMETILAYGVACWKKGCRILLG